MAVKAAVEFIKAVARKLLAKPAKPGEGITSIANRMNAEAKAGEIAAILQEAGIPINRLDDFIKSEKDVIKYLNIIESSKPKGPTIGGHRVIDATSSEGKGITEKLFGKKGEVIKVDFDPTGKNTFKGMSEGVEDVSFKPGMDPKGKIIVESPTQIIARMKKMTPMDAMKEANSVIGRKGKYKKLTPEESKKILKDTEDHIFERDIKYDEFGDPIKPDPEDFAGGGRASTGLNYLLGEDDQNVRVPYGLGGGFNAARRAFLKIMGAGAATGVAAKSGLFSLLKAGKPAAQVLTSVPIKAGVDGMPAWFKPLVNKVIKEGEDVTKKFSTMDREIVHAAELPGSKTKVLVSQDITTGNVAVDIGYGKHGFSAGHHGQPVRLEYKAAEEIEPILAKHMDPKNSKGEWLPNKGQKTKEEFWVEEAEFTGGRPENVKFEDVSYEKFGEHGSDFSEVEEFATGLKKGKGGSGHMASGGLAGMLGE